MKTRELIAEVVSLPVEERAAIVDSLLQSLNPADADLDRKWLAEAERRLDEVRSGQAALVSGDDVFAAIKKRFGQRL